jgi:membrane-associated phospholipid phosphatase
MLSLKKKYVVILFILLSNICCAQTDSVKILSANDTIIFTKPNLLKSLGHIPADMWYIAKAPFKKQNLKGLGIVTASTLILVAKDQAITNWVRKASSNVCLQHNENYKVPFAPGGVRIIKVPQNLNSFLYQLGEGGTSMLLAGGLWLSGKINHNNRDIQTAADLTETFLSMGITTQILKRISGRQSPSAATVAGGLWRPFPTFNAYQKNTSSFDAFPSGHLATMMATVTVLAYNYPHKKWIRPVGFTIMGLTSWAMVNSNVHWAGDYPLALAVGYLAGRITTKRHIKKQRKIDLN